MTLFYDWYSGRWFNHDYIKLRRILFNIEERANKGEFITWNNYYDSIEIPNVMLGRSIIGRPEHNYKFKFKLTANSLEKPNYIIIYVDE